MADLIYHVWLEDILGASADMDGTDTLNCCLLQSGYTPSTAHATYANLTNEVPNGSGYTTGGAAMSGQAITAGGGNPTYWDADNVQWTTATFTAAYAVIYDVTNANSLVVCIDFGGDKSVSNGTFTIDWDANGIISLTPPS